MPAIVGMTRLIKTGAKVADAAQAAEVAVKTAETAAEVAPVVSPNRVPMSKLLPAKEPGPLADKFQGEAFHFTMAPEEFKQFDLKRTTPSIWDSLGVHVGTKAAARDRARIMGFDETDIAVVAEDIKRVGEEEPYVPPGHSLELKFNNDKPYLNYRNEPWTENSFKDFLRKMSEEPWIKTKVSSLLNADPNYRKINEVLDNHSAPREQREAALSALTVIRRKATAKAIALDLERSGYTHVPYINDVEDADSISYIVLNPKRNLRHKNAAFHLEYTSLMGTIVPMAIGGAAAAGGEDEAR